MNEQARCRFVAMGMPRLVCAEQRHERGEWCESCHACPEAHCRVCGIAHHQHACANCLDEVRTDLHEIREKAIDLYAEAEVRGPTSEAVMLIGPAADPEARGHMEASVAAGRIPPSYLGDVIGEEHPDWVLGTWEMVYRDAFDHETPEPYSLTKAVRYLDQNLTYASTWEHVPFEDLARDLRRCAGHLEAVLHDLEQRGVPCLLCKTPMVRAVDAKGDTTDDWWCERCRKVVNANHYRFAASTAHRAEADRLCATDLAERIGVPPSTIRRWASIRRTTTRGRWVDGEFVPGVITERAPLLSSCGTDPLGRKVYRVATAEALRDTLRVAC